VGLATSFANSLLIAPQDTKDWSGQSGQASRSEHLRCEHHIVAVVGIYSESELPPAAAVLDKINNQRIQRPDSPGE